MIFPARCVIKAHWSEPLYQVPTRTACARHPASNSAAPALQGDAAMAFRVVVWNPLSLVRLGRRDVVDNFFLKVDVVWLFKKLL